MTDADDESQVLDLTGLAAGTSENEPFVLPEVAMVTPPSGGLWRVGRAVDPMRASVCSPDVERSARQGNRFDTSDFGTIYMGSTLEACFGETLARYRPKPDLAALVAEDWKSFMAPGQVAAEWREKRSTVHVLPGADHMFVDIEAIETREYLRKALALGLSALGYEDLDVPVIRGNDRRVTRLVAQWAFRQSDEDGFPLFHGIRYLSKLNTEWECWAIWEDFKIAAQRVESIPADHPALESVANLFGLHVH